MEVPFEFLNAKLRGRRRLVHEGGRLRELARCTSVEELAGRLYPREVIAGRLGLERRLRQDCATELTHWSRYLSGGIACFYNALVRRFQIKNIQVLLRLFAGGQEEPLPEQYLPELPTGMGVSAGELLSSGDLTEFVGKLPEDLARAATGAQQEWNETGTVAFTAMALERAYWDGVMRAARRLPAAQVEACMAPILCEVSGARIMAALRAGRNYDIQWERLEALAPRCDSALAGGAPFHVSDATLRELHADPSPQSVAAKVPAVARPEDAESLMRLEGLIWERAFRLANRAYYSITEGPAVLVGYFYVRRNELKNLAGLAESLHYGKPFGEERDAD